MKIKKLSYVVISKRDHNIMELKNWKRGMYGKIA